VTVNVCLRVMRVWMWSVWTGSITRLGGLAVVQGCGGGVQWGRCRVVEPHGLPVTTRVTPGTGLLTKFAGFNVHACLFLLDD